MRRLPEPKKGQLKAGEFLFKAHTSIDEAIETLIQGKAILHALTLPEGLTSEQIIGRLRDNDVLTGDVPRSPREGTCCPTPTSSSAARRASSS